ncbi:hypothetical protein LWI28_004909 [Acer negundo]|uniref:Uncharacterized protein n=1 Tax=Acer negundo TaxID=4023 RepID=A0AAD5IFU0_ACENE|nr:hypothetical protein LWI28_018879 [Acer negundo]KAI9188622.1 hypothetical protein LWI28_004909 [Acer negundo]
MDCSDRKSVSSSSSSTHVIKPSSTSKPSVSDENYQSNSENGANPPPSPPTKHFMSPTISAASKAIAPRKKILAERNENSDTLIQKTLISVQKPNRGRDIILRHENEAKGEKERSITDEVTESEEVDEREEGVEEEEEERRRRRRKKRRERGFVEGF